MLKRVQHKGETGFPPLEKRGEGGLKGHFSMKPPDLLAPAGDLEKLKTAIHYG